MGSCCGRRTRPKKHVSDASVPRCHGLSEQAPPPVCSLLVVEDVLDVIRTRYLDTRTCSWTTLHGFILFFGWFFKQNTRGSFACCLLLYFYCFVIFRVSFSAKVYAPGPHGGCIISRKRASLLHNQIKVMVALLFMCSYIVQPQSRFGKNHLQFELICNLSPKRDCGS